MSYIISIILGIIMWELIKFFVAYLYKCSKECVQHRVENTNIYKRYKATTKR
jgi:hypothetical protein